MSASVSYKNIFFNYFTHIHFTFTPHSNKKTPNKKSQCWNRRNRNYNAKTHVQWFVSKIVRKTVAQNNDTDSSFNRIVIVFVQPSSIRFCIRTNVREFLRALKCMYYTVFWLAWTEQVYHQHRSGATILCYTCSVHAN